MTAKPIACACILIVAAAAAMGGQAPKPPATAPDAEGQEGTRLKADLFAREGADVLYAIGHVRLERGGNVITADGAVVWTRDQEAYLEGNVVYRLGGSLLQAENAYVHWSTTKDPKTGKESTQIDRGFLVRANVVWQERPDSVPWHVRADQVVQTDVKRFVARHKVMLSTCEFYEPHAYFVAREVIFVADEKIIANDITYNVQGVALPPDAQGWWIPPFYWPSLYVPLGWKWPEINFDFGSSSRYGSYVKSEVIYQLPRPVIGGVTAKIGPRLDYYTKRGIGFGGVLAYERDNDVRGALDYYSVPDDDGKDRDDFDLGETDRYRVKFFHSQDAPEGWEFDAEFQKWSDAGFRQEFFRREFYEDKPIENRLYLKYADGPFAGYAHYKWQEDEWLDTTEYLPQIGLNVFSFPIWGNLIYTGHIEVANVRRELSDLRLPPNPTVADMAAAAQRAYDDNFIHDPLESTPHELMSDDRRFWRLSTYHELAFPFDVSILNIEPFVGTRQTWYEKTLDDDDSDSRGLYTYGIRASTQFWKNWEDVECDGLRLCGLKVLPLEIDGLRHIITPEIRVLVVEDSGMEYDDIILTDDDGTTQPTADPWYDGFHRIMTGPSRWVSRPRAYYSTDTTGIAFGDVNDIVPFRVVNFGLRNRWQTWRNGKIVDLVDLDTDVDIFFGDKDVNNGDSWSDFKVDLRVNPIEGVSFFCDFAYNIGGNDYWRRHRDGTFSTSDSAIPTFNTGLQIAVSKRWQVYLSQRYEADEANCLGLAVSYIISDKWRATVQYEYDTEDSDASSFGVRFSRDMHDWIVDLIVEDDSFADDKMIGIGLQPKLRRTLASRVFYSRELASDFNAQTSESCQQYDY